MSLLKTAANLQLLDSYISITNTGGSYGVGIENIGGTAMIGKPQTGYDYNWITVGRGYGIKSRNYLTNQGELTIYGLYCQVNEDYNGESAVIKAEDASSVVIKGGQKKDCGGETFTTVDLCASGKNSYGLDFADRVYWSIMGSENGVCVRGGQAAVKAKAEYGYSEYITTGIYLSDNAPFDIYYAGAAAARGASILLPDSNYYFDWYSAYDSYGCSGVIVRNAEAELVEYLEAPYEQYETFVLPCDIIIGRYAEGADYYYGAYARTNSVEIELPGRVVDLNGYNIFINSFDDYAFLQIFGGDLKLINSSEDFMSTIYGGDDTEILVEVFKLDDSEAQGLYCDNIVMQNGFANGYYDIYALEGGVVINSGLYYDDIDFGTGVNVINDGQFADLMIRDWSHSSGKQNGCCLILKGGQYTGSYERIEFEYPNEENEPNSLFAKDANDTTALIPYGYELNAYDRDGNKIRTLSEADFVTTEAAYSDEWSEYVITEKGITLDFTLGGTAAVCRVEKAEPVTPPYNPPYNPGSGYSGGSSSGRTKKDDKPSAAAIEFTDVPKGAYFEDAVAWAIKNEVTNGTGEKTFSPYRLCTRAEDICFLFRAAKGAGAKGKSVSFDDVPADSYYKEALEWAVANGITGGTWEGLFSPDTVTSREVFLTMLYRTACIIDPNAKKAGEKALAAAHAPGSTSKFGDVPEGSFAEEAIYWAKEAGIVNGVGDTLINGVWVSNAFGFGRDVDRAQTVTILYRYFGK